MGRIDDCAHDTIGNSLITVLGSLNSADIDFNLISVVVIDVGIGLIKFAEMFCFAV